MSDEMIAYLTTLAAIVVLVIAGAVLAYHGKLPDEAGITVAVTGLIGLIQAPWRRRP